jgi:hypothetical protein
VSFGIFVFFYFLSWHFISIQLLIGETLLHVRQECGFLLKGHFTIDAGRVSVALGVDKAMFLQRVRACKVLSTLVTLVLFAGDMVADVPRAVVTTRKRL